MLRSLALAACLVVVPNLALASDDIFGDWALTLPTGEAGWLSVNKLDRGAPRVELLWAVGSAKEVTDATLVSPNVLRLVHTSAHQGTKETHTILANAQGDTLRCSIESPSAALGHGTITGVRIPPLPPAPDLSTITFDAEVPLFNGRDLSGWEPVHLLKADFINGWSARDGLLINSTPKSDFSAYGDYANLRTTEEFDDFALHIEYRLPDESGGNSGIYLRGMYEVQVTHNNGKLQGKQGPGAVYGRIAPTQNAGQPPGHWEVLDVILVDRHVTITLNGKKVVDNQPLAGCTGGALQADPTRSGPLLLQGDHTSVEYRNVTLRRRLP